MTKTQSNQEHRHATAPKLALPLCSTLGVLIAFAIVLVWFPHSNGLWNSPLQQIDAPAHYYFIRKILKYGPGVALHLQDNGAYYPPLFHLLAAGVVALGDALGLPTNVYAGLNITWLATSGLLWPASMSLLASYWTRQVDGTTESDGTAHHWRLFSCGMALIVPVLAVSSASHPFFMLASGPLISYGLATSLLPFWLYATLRCFDAITSHHSTGTWILLTVLLGLLCLFAHPRIAFTWLLLMAPFILMRLPWKLIMAAIATVAVCAVAFFWYMTGHYHSSRYLDPSSWFHTFKPSRSVTEALRILACNNIPGLAGAFMAIVVVVALAIVLAVAIRVHGKIRKDAIAVLLVAALVALVYVCSASLTGWFANIVAAAWYRSEPRPLTMIPFAIIELLTFAACAVARQIGPYNGTLAGSLTHSPATDPENNLANRTTNVQSFAYTQARQSSLRQTVAILVLAALALSCQFGNTTRSSLASALEQNVQLAGAAPDSQLNDAKVAVLRQTVAITGTNALIISDPLNGSMYASTMYGANMLFPIYNEAHEKNGAIFGKVEGAFTSGNGDSLLNTACPVGTTDQNGMRSNTYEGSRHSTAPVYFLAMGPQAPSLKMFTFRQQYDTFHDQKLIDAYVHEGTMTKVKDFHDPAKPYTKGWALYRLGCGR